MECTKTFSEREMERQNDVKRIIEKIEIDYSTTDLQVAYQELRNKINLEKYFDYERDNNQSLFYFALNVRVLPEGSFIPFIYINIDDENKTFEIKDWATNTYSEGVIQYSFSDFLQDDILNSINVKYPQSEFFFKTQFDEKWNRYLIKEFQVVPQGVKREKTAISFDIIEKINKRLIELDGKDFVQQMSQFFHKTEGDIPYFFPNSNGQFFFALYSFDSDYKTNSKLTNWLILSDSQDEIENFVNQRIRLIRDLASLIRIRYTRDILRKQELESIKSAKAAIMSRNMSHNIGSHVMSYLKQHLGSVKDIVADGILSDLINGENELAKKLENTTENTTLPFLLGLGHFISYIQERQDFIATIATDYIPYFGNINFKDIIYDELNPDKRAERHTERTNGKTDNILLGNIARSEGLGRNNQSTSRRSGQLADIVLNFQDSDNNVFDGNPVVNKDNPIAGRENAKKALDAMRKWEISVPGGVIGRQAVFSIVENLIRNTAKHGNWRDQGKLELTFNCYTKDSLTEEFCNLKEREADILRRNTDKDGKLKELSQEDENKLNDIRKSLEKWTEDAVPTEEPHYWGEDKKKHNSLMEVLWYFYGQSLDADDLYFVTITDNVNISEKAVKKLRDALMEDYIDNESKMIEGNKGIKEIRISAAWLRGAKNEEEYYNSGAKLIDPQTWKKAPLVYVRQHSGCLQYIICLQKPRKLAVVSQRLPSEESEKAFKKLNCRYYTPETYRKEKNKSFDFILFDDSNKAEKEEYSYDALKPISSSRFWKLSDIAELAKKDDKEEPELFKRLQNVTEESLNDILLILYKRLSHYEAEDAIWIDDKTAAANVGRDTDGITPKYIKSDNITVRDGISKGVHKYIYRTHHDSEKEYNNFIDAVNNRTIESNIFVEGISGNNSTDRLVRNEILNDVWFYKHLHAMKEQVAIFDERLFTKIFGLEESHLKDEGTFKIDDSNRDLYRERYYEEIVNSDDVQYNSFVDDNTPEEQDKILWETFKNETSPTTSIESVNTLTGFKPIVYKQKNVFVFTLIQDPNPDRQNVFNLYGLSKESNISKAICSKIASLSWSQIDGLIFEGEITKKGDNFINNYKRFDCMSIHQGLLDKLYEVFGIKDQQKEKERLTRQFHQAFSTSFVNKIKSDDENSEMIVANKDLPFLQGLCIHSGRSKPSQIDMPQKLPFIQYASIENAVLDCKYSLVELLDFARYE